MSVSPHRWRSEAIAELLRAIERLQSAQASLPVVKANQALAEDLDDVAHWLHLVIINLQAQSRTPRAHAQLAFDFDVRDTVANARRETPAQPVPF